MKITRPEKNIKVTTFDSIQEMVGYIKTAPVADVFKKIKGNRLESEKSETYDNWYGTKTIDEAHKLLSTGWIDKSRELEQKFTDRVKREATAVTHQRSVYDVVGGNCSVPRYLQGVPTNMIRQVKQTIKEKVVTVNYSCAFSCRVSAQEITENAIDCLSYVKKLEDSGTRVNVNVIWPTSKDNKYLTWVVPVKKSNERLSIAKLAFTLCHPSMLRRIMFCCLEREPEATEMFVWGYGTPVKDKTTLERILPGTTVFNAFES